MSGHLSCFTEFPVSLSSPLLLKHTQNEACEVIPMLNKEKKNPQMIFDVNQGLKAETQYKSCIVINSHEEENIFFPWER